MKKVLSLLMVAMLALSAWADKTVTLDFTAQGYSGGQQVHELSIDGVTVTFDKGTNTNNPPAYYTGGNAVRLYPGNKMTVSAQTNVKKIDFTFGSSDNTNNILCNVGSYNKAGKQWTIGSSDPTTAVEFGVDGNSGHRRIAKLDVTIEDANPVTELVAPVFTPAGGDFSGSTLVTLTCETQNAQIFWFYGTEEEQGTHHYYDGPFPITESCTLTAYSTWSDQMSDYVTVTFNKVEQTVEAPVFTPAAGPFNDRIEVTLACATPGARIYYSLDQELWSEYIDAIPVTDDITIWAKAVVGDVESEVVSATYTKNPATTVEVPFDAEQDKGDGSTTRHSYTIVKGDVTMYVGDGTVYPNHYRIYGKTDSAAFTFTSVGAPIIKIELNGYDSNTPSNLSLPEGQSGTYTTGEMWGKWEGNAQVVSFQINSQVRCSSIVVTLAGGEADEYPRGDVNRDRTVDIDDVTALIDIILKGLEWNVEADCDYSGNADIDDVTLLIDYILKGSWE